MMFPSEPGTFNFVNRITTWMKRQRKRLWVMVPFWDSVGVAMINVPLCGIPRIGKCTAEDIRIICRPGEIQKYLRKEVFMRFNKDLHTKMMVGDSASLMGSFNMTYQAMFDNLEQATFSRSQKYPEHFLSEWERLSQLEEG
jgi:phosphatidylserine/phosphatidylglycerophosphate/cardiolipin synthase-like enzyme